MIRSQIETACKISHLYSQSQHLVAALPFLSEADSPLRPYLRATVYEIVDGDFAEDHFPRTPVNKDKRKDRGYADVRERALSNGENGVL